MSEPVYGTRIVRALRGGQITLPADFRRALEIEEGTMLAISLSSEGQLTITPPRFSKGPSKGSTWLKEIYEMFADARQEAIDKGYTEEEINQWIDEAVEASRRDRAASQLSDQESVEQVPATRRSA